MKLRTPTGFSLFNPQRLLVAAASGMAIALLCPSSPAGAVPVAQAAAESPLYFGTAREAVVQANALLTAQDWTTLARYYDLSLTPQVDPATLRDGSFFCDAHASATGPAAITRWKHPFARGSRFLDAQPVGDPGSQPSIWTVTTALEIDQGGGPAQRVVRETRMIRTASGFQFLPPAPTEGMRPPSPAPSADAWQARGADAVLLYRPSLRTRADQEIPAGRSSNIPALVEAIEKLRPATAQHAGKVKPGNPGLGEPENVYEPTDDELLLSLAGDRIWRSLQIAPPGILANVRTRNPDWKPHDVEYPHIEIQRVAVAGAGPHAFAQPPLVRHLTLEEHTP